MFAPKRSSHERKSKGSREPKFQRTLLDPVGLSDHGVHALPYVEMTAKAAVDECPRVVLTNVYVRVWHASVNDRRQRFCYRSRVDSIEAVVRQTNVDVRQLRDY